MSDIVSLFLASSTRLKSFCLKRIPPEGCYFGDYNQPVESSHSIKREDRTFGKF